MDTPKIDPTKNLDDASDATDSSLSSIEWSTIKHILSMKIEKNDAHYTSMVPLGDGSFGEVHSALDSLLGREVAIKSLNKNFNVDDEVLERFLKEARGTAQLEHPNIMPVHELGMSDELGIYFTMKKVQGETLKEILDQLTTHPAFFKKKYPLNVLLEIFLAVCNGVAFAHSKGMIHRDLKPANIMVGKYGEVLVLDWGLVKELNAIVDSSSKVQLQMNGLEEGFKTFEGTVAGTPNYMAPEQAEGRIKNINFQSDVYSLGAILYHLLTYVPPFEKVKLRLLLENVKTGRFLAPRNRCPSLKIPRELEAICLKAMALHQVSRYRSVDDFAQDIRAYIGSFKVSAYKAPRWVRFWKTCKRNPIKSSVIVAVVCVLGLVFGMQKAMLYGSYVSGIEKANELRLHGNRLVTEVMGLYDQRQALCCKIELKTKSRQEIEFEKAIVEKELSIVATYNVAEALYESIPMPYKKNALVMEGYIDIMRHRIEYALHQKQYDQANQWLETVRLRFKQSPGVLNEKTARELNLFQQQIDGFGSLEITSLEGAVEVIVWPLINDGPRKVSGDAIARGKLPLQLDVIKKGSYLLMVMRSDTSLIPYPVYIGHGEKKRVDLKIPEQIPEGMVYVPDGTFFYGGSDSRFYRKHLRTLKSFFIKKYEVTVGEYIEFWNDLGDASLKNAYMSRIRFQQKDQKYMDAWNGAGELMDARLDFSFPIVGITREAAEAFCTWKSQQVGAVIRLPSAEEWEKAARGVDGRRYVWGDEFTVKANLTLTAINRKGKARYPLWASPGKFPRDITVYNAYDMAGNVREMTSTKLPDSDTFYQIKGGSGATPPTFLPCCYASDTPVVPSDVGFRYIQEMPVHKAEAGGDIL